MGVGNRENQLPPNHERVFTSRDRSIKPEFAESVDELLPGDRGEVRHGLGVNLDGFGP